jgi:threonine dehydrogenase-like Zn-dependent dehydrogenase
VRAVRNAPPSVEVVEVEEPGGAGELVRVTSVGICASDLLYLRYGSTRIAGHEIAGVLADGTEVAVEGIFGCGECPECAAGRYHYCPALLEGALGMTADGGMSEWFRAPRRALVPLPAGLRARDACLVEPGAVAWHAAALGGVGPDTRVAVVGAGAIGLLATAAAQRMGAAEVAVVARHRHQHEVRERLGAGEATGDYDVVLETAGSDTSLAAAADLARHRGTIITVGVFDAMTWPHAASRKELAVQHSLGYAGTPEHREFADVAALLAERPELVDALITHRFPLVDAAAAFATARDRAQGVFRVVVEP